MSGAMTLPDGWVEATLGDLGQVVRGVTYKKDQVRESPAAGYLPLLRATNIAAELIFADFVYVPETVVSPEQRLRKNDIVIAASSGSIKVVGKAAQLRHDWDGTFGAFCAVFRTNPLVNPQYIAAFMSSPAYRARVSSLAAGVNINNLKREHLLTMSVPLPFPDEQAAVAEAIGASMEKVDEGVASFVRALNEAERLRRSLLHAAFSGRLTARVPHDKSAADYLLQVRADGEHQAAEVKAARSRRRTRPQSRSTP
jgi:type I restriction enzyme S subunit